MPRYNAVINAQTLYQPRTHLSVTSLLVLVSTLKCGDLIVHIID